MGKKKQKKNQVRCFLPLMSQGCMLALGHSRAKWWNSSGPSAFLAEGVKPKLMVFRSLSEASWRPESCFSVTMAQFRSFGHYPKLMTIGEETKIDWKIESSSPRRNGVEFALLQTPHRSACRSPAPSFPDSWTRPRDTPPLGAGSPAGSGEGTPLFSCLRTMASDLEVLILILPAMLQSRVNHDSPTTSRALRHAGWVSSTSGALPPIRFFDHFGNLSPRDTISRAQLPAPNSPRPTPCAPWLRSASHHPHCTQCWQCTASPSSDAGWWSRTFLKPSGSHSPWPHWTLPTARSLPWRPPQVHSAGVSAASGQVPQTLTLSHRPKSLDRTPSSAWRQQCVNGWMSSTFPGTWLKLSQSWELSFIWQATLPVVLNRQSYIWVCRVWLSSSPTIGTSSPGGGWLTASPPLS